MIQACLGRSGASCPMSRRWIPNLSLISDPGELVWNRRAAVYQNLPVCQNRSTCVVTILIDVIRLGYDRLSIRLGIVRDKNLSGSNGKELPGRERDRRQESRTGGHRRGKLRYVASPG